jgi:hypothetical protein
VAFRKMAVTSYPPRLWALAGHPGSGKSTFAAQMRAPILAIDADHRFQEVLSLVKGDVYELSDNPADDLSSDRIAALLAENMPGTHVGTIVVDSLTAIIGPLVKEAGREKNLAAAFRAKALAMRQLQDAVTSWGTDVLWIYHLKQARDARGNPVARSTTVPQTELDRLKRSLNLELEIVQEGDRRGIRVTWARRGRCDVPVLWDESGTWAGLPERIEAAVYGGLGEEQQASREQGALELRYGDGSAPGANPAELAAFQQYLAAQGQPPPDIAALRAWKRRRG